MHGSAFRPDKAALVAVMLVGAMLVAAVPVAAALVAAVPVAAALVAAVPVAAALVAVVLVALVLVAVVLVAAVLVAAVLVAAAAPPVGVGFPPASSRAAGDGTRPEPRPPRPLCAARLPLQQPNGRPPRTPSRYGPSPAG